MNKNTSIIIGVTFIICAVFGYFLTYKQIGNTLQMNKDIAKTKNDANEVSQKKTILDNLSKNNELNTLYDIASKYIPVQTDSSQLILELSAIASTSNLKVDQFSLEKADTAAAATTDTTTTDTAKTAAPTTTAPTGDNISELPFKMKVTGTFPDYLTFLTNVQTCSRLVTITAMNLLQDTSGFSSQITGKAYYKKADTSDQSINNVNISQEIISRLKNLKTFGTPINLPTETGFGRSNPFDQVK